MAPSKREYERRRYEKWQQRLAARVARRRRQRALIAAVVVGVLVVGAGVAAAIVTLGRSDDASPAAETGSPSSDALVPDAALAEGRTWSGTLRTSQGDIGLELDGASAPQAVANFVTLARDSYFDSTACHRLVTTGIKVLQCGDPTGTGTGGPGYSWGPIENAPADDFYPAGTIAMARVGGDGESMGSQFFLVYEDSTIQSDAAGGYTVFGRITSGLDVVQAIADAGNGDDGVAPALDVIIEGVETQ